MAEGVTAGKSIEQVQVKASEVFVPTAEAVPPATTTTPTETAPTVAEEIVREITLEPTTLAQDEYEPLPTFSIPKRSLIVDIETTGTLPFQSRIIAISYLDPSNPTGQIQVMIEPDEKTLVQNFVDIFESNAYDEIVGYNAPFDYRFLFAACTRYRIPAPRLFAAEVYDLQDVYDKVRPGEVFGRNKSGTLEDWSIYLLGFGKATDYNQVIEAWEKQDFKLIAEHVQNDVLVTYYLWLLDGFVKGRLQIAQSTELEALQVISQESPTKITTTKGEESSSVVFCSRCSQEAERPAVGQTFKCSVCSSDQFRSSL